MLHRERAAAIAQLQAAEGQQQRALLAEVARQVDESRRWFEALLVLLGVVVIAIVVTAAVLWHLLVEHRRLRERLAS
jgi:hypothetical protein